MNGDSEVVSLPDYGRFLRPLMPKRAFAPSPGKLVVVALHLLVVGTGFALIRVSNHWTMWIACSLLVGHSLACIAFLAHELSHNTIVRGRRWRYVFELLFWGLNLISATVWRRVHNYSHHNHTNTPNDPDRQFMVSEASTLRALYTFVFYPNRRSLRWNVLVGVHFIPYILRNMIAAFYPEPTKPDLVPSKPTYSIQQRLAVACELAFILVLQIVLFVALGSSWSRYLFAGPIAICVASCVVMVYVFTNHFLNDLCEENDPVVNSTSVIVPRIFDRLHSNFSYHTEHHLFPGMNSDYYPIVSNLLREHFGDRYNRVQLLAAWRRLWSNELFISYEAGGHIDEP